MLFKNQFSVLIILLIHFNRGITYAQKEFLQNCESTKQHGQQILRIDAESRPFEVVCETNTYGDGWTVILNRYDGSVDFSQRTCQDYKFGFGNLSREYFLGLDQLNALTSVENHMLLVLMSDFNGTEYVSTYDTFIVWDETFEYTTGVSSTFHSGIDAGFTKWNAFCSACSKRRCMNYIPGWQLNPYLEPPKINPQSVIQFFGIYPENSADIARSRMGIYNLTTKQLLPLRTLKMMIRPFKAPNGFKGHAKGNAQLDKRYLPFDEN